MGMSRLLIANRGEIAVRIAKSAHRLGLDTVGVYSTPDENALHTNVVDEAVALGGTTPAESYLRADAILEAAKRTGATAVHPGYGFLAESADFAQQVIDAGLTWVGPTPDQISKLGDKITAKRTASGSGVPTTPIFEVAPGLVPPDVPMPALVKAAAGGGGRGVRIVRTPDELADAVDAAAREADAAFGDGTVFIEPFIERGRHIEVQILGDAHGDVVHFGERECSIQRRNQKVIEESPSAGISDEIRSRLHAGALALARAVGYQNAGTVEFLVGDDDTVTFLEVNTRLQVEHPVTEAVTGIDLVELQLRVADGEPLGLSQDDIRVEGHAIEARVVAEDPSSGWLPSTGTLTCFEMSDEVRVDTGFATGSLVSSDYDSLLAKVIAHAASRDQAARLLGRALRSSCVAGVETNLNALQAILADRDFLDANTPITYLDEHPRLASPDLAEPVRRALLLGAVFALEHQNRRTSPTRFAPSGWRNLRTVGQRVVLESTGSPGDVCHVEYVLDGRDADVLLGTWPEIQDDGSLAEDERERLAVRLLERIDTRQVVEIDGLRSVVDTEISPAEGVVLTSCPRGSRSWSLRPLFVEPDTTVSGSGPVSPLPGTVISVAVSEGDVVDEGRLLVTVEAMKMEHRITATVSGIVKTVHYGVGDRVDAGDLLVTIEAMSSNEPD